MVQTFIRLGRLSIPSPEFPGVPWTQQVQTAVATLSLFFVFACGENREAILEPNVEQIVQANFEDYCSGFELEDVTTGPDFDRVTARFLPSSECSFTSSRLSGAFDDLKERELKVVIYGKWQLQSYLSECHPEAESYGEWITLLKRNWRSEELGECALKNWPQLIALNSEIDLKHEESRFWTSTFQASAFSRSRLASGHSDPVALGVVTRNDGSADLICLSGSLFSDGQTFRILADCLGEMM